MELKERSSIQKKPLSDDDDDDVGRAAAAAASGTLWSREGGTSRGRGRRKQQ